MKPQRLDITVWTILGVIGLALAGVLAGNTLVGVRVVKTFPANAARVDDTGRIGLQFAEPMQPETVEPRFVVDPPAAGTFQWDGDKLWFTPAKPWRPDVTYSAKLQAGATSRAGRSMRLAAAWTFSGRTPWIVYLAPALGSPRRLWRIPSTGGAAQQLSPSEAAVQEFDVSPDGRQIVYSSPNAQGGIDLWQMAGDGQNPQLLVNCADSLCTEPKWSPDGRQIAFDRNSPGLTPGSAAPTRVWLVDAGNRQTKPLYDDPQIVSGNPHWSPDGRRLAVAGGEDYRIRVLDLTTRQELLLPSPAGDISWSPDGQQLFYRDTQRVEGNLTATLQRADIPAGTHETVRVIDPTTHLGPFAWAPTGDWLTVAEHPAGRPGLDQQLWLLTPDLHESRAITTAPGYIYPDYHWDPWGLAVVALRFPTVPAGAAPELVLWAKTPNTLTVLVTNAISPAWQP